jgi:parvulin-like peptidyl-prolyl isomerase
MMRISFNKYVIPAALGIALCAAGADGKAFAAPDEQGPAGRQPAATAANSEEPADVIARVGDQAITFSEINTMLNSSAVVGVSIPAIGTPQRDTVRITLLDKVVSANLLYLDALKRGVDKDPTYRAALDKFTDGILIVLYRERYLSDQIEVSEEEIQAYYEENITPGTEMTPELRSVLEASIRRNKVREQVGQMRARLREGVKVELNDAELDPLKDAERADDAVLATIDGEALRWGDVKATLGQAVSTTSKDSRRQAVNAIIDKRIVLEKAAAAGLEQDPVFRKRFNEYHKTRLINLHRQNLAREFEPSEEQMRAFYQANRDSIVEPEFRKLQMVVVKTKEEADDIKTKLDAGDITLYQAARDHSIDPAAKQNLGEIGWVNEGKAVPALDELIFSLGPGEIGGPVETSAGWHLVMVQDVREAKFDVFEDQATRKLTRRKYIHEKLDLYVVNLRKSEFPVEVYEDRLIELAQQEADMVKQLAERAAEPGSVTQERLKEMQKIYDK